MVGNQITYQIDPRFDYVAGPMGNADWIAGRAKSEEDGQIIDNIVSQLLVPTPFSAVK